MSQTPSEPLRRRTRPLAPAPSPASVRLLNRGAHPAPWLHAESGRPAIVVIGHGGRKVGEDWVREGETERQAIERCVVALIGPDSVPVS